MTCIETVVNLLVLIDTSGRRCSQSQLGSLLETTLVDRYFHYNFPFSIVLRRDLFS